MDPDLYLVAFLIQPWGAFGYRGSLYDAQTCFSFLYHTMLEQLKQLKMVWHCADAFNKWEAGQRLAKKLLVKLYEAATSGKARPLILFIRSPTEHAALLLYNFFPLP